MMDANSRRPLVERVAQMIHANDGGDTVPANWDAVNHVAKRLYRSTARDVIEEVADAVEKEAVQMDLTDAFLEWASVVEWLREQAAEEEV